VWVACSCSCWLFASCNQPTATSASISHQKPLVQCLLKMDAWRPKHVENQDTVKWLWKLKCIKLVTLLWSICLLASQNNFTSKQVFSGCTVQCTVFGQWNFQIVGLEQAANATSFAFGLFFLTASVSTADLVMWKFQANKHPPHTSSHPVGPSASCTRDWFHGYRATTLCAPRPWASRPFVHRHLVPSIISRGALCQATPETSVSKERKRARNVRII
jgi:hypothetical protein